MDQSEPIQSSEPWQLTGWNIPIVISGDILEKDIYTIMLNLTKHIYGKFHFKNESHSEVRVVYEQKHCLDVIYCLIL